MIKVLVFDLDDTLFPEHEFVLSGFQVVSNWVATRYTVFGFFKVASQLFEEGKRNQIFNLTLEELKVEYEPRMIQELLQIYRKHKPHISLYEDAKWAIDYFKQYKQLGLVTDGYLLTQRNKVKSLGIEATFHSIVYSDLYGRENWKPSPIPYLKIMKSTGYRGAEYIYVGDNPCKDFVTAKQLDWMTVQICREGGEYSSITTEKSYEADRKITSLFQLKELL